MASLPSSEASGRKGSAAPAGTSRAERAQTLPASAPSSADPAQPHKIFAAIFSRPASSSIRDREFRNPTPARLPPASRVLFGGPDFSKPDSPLHFFPGPDVPHAVPARAAHDLSLPASDERSHQTARIKMRPLTMYCQKGSISSMLMPLSRLTMTSAPIMEPVTLPVPPLRLVPPITQAAMASSSNI